MEKLWSEVVFVAAVLHLLEEKWRGVGRSDSLDRLLRTGAGSVPNLHKAWLKVREEMGERSFEAFAPDFSFDPLYGTSNLRSYAQTAAANLLLNLDSLGYHADALEKEEVAHTIANIRSIPPGFAETFATRLNQLLDEEEARSLTLH